MAAPLLKEGSLFAAAFEVRRDAPVANFSRKLPKLRIVQWCTEDMDIFQLSGPGDDIESFREWVISDFGIRQAYATADGVLLVCQLCRCGVEESRSLNAIYRSVLAWDVPPIVYREGWENRRVITVNEAFLRELFKAILRIGELRIVSMRPIENFGMERMMLMPASDVFSGLTDKQSGALLLGLRHGYYSTPSGTKVDQLADGLGLSPSTVAEHLRKAEARILQNLRPYLEAYSTRSPGEIAVGGVRTPARNGPRAAVPGADSSDARARRQ
jgi:predicted DNA binding protein